MPRPETPRAGGDRPDTAITTPHSLRSVTEDDRPDDELMAEVRWHVEVERAVRHREFVASGEWVSPFVIPGSLRDV